jgi:hypothetical protein
VEKSLALKELLQVPLFVFCVFAVSWSLPLLVYRHIHHGAAHPMLPLDLQRTFIGLRDYAMLLLYRMIAFRGDNLRNLLWSDLFSTNIPMDEISLGTEVKVCGPACMHILSH